MIETKSGISNKVSVIEQVSRTLEHFLNLIQNDS